MTVIAVLRLWLKSHEEPDFSGIYQSVMIDEMCTWVGGRNTGKRWLWYVYCGQSRKMLAFQIGKRDDATCKKLMRKLAHLKIKHFYTDNRPAARWKSYKKHTVTKKKTQKIERQNLNFRTHIKRLCRKTISFSKKDDMHLRDDEGLHLAQKRRLITAYPLLHYQIFFYPSLNPSKHSDTRPFLRNTKGSTILPPPTQSA